MRTVVLMPSFGYCPYRDKNELHVIHHYERTWGLPVVRGLDSYIEGFFARTRAINAAAREAVSLYPDVEAFVLCDNDLIPDPKTFRQALEAVGDHAAITPHNLTLMTTRVGRLQYLKSGVQRNYSPLETGSRSFVVIRREVFVAVNGMDELFYGWGPEDVAFLESVRKQVGPVLELDGQRFHLWHPTDPSKFKKEARIRNRARFHQYVVSTPDQVRVLAREYGSWDASVPPTVALPQASSEVSVPEPLAQPKRKFDHDVGLRNVRDMLQTLTALGVRAWVQDGTLLGLVRDGKLIDYDHDTDTGAMIEDLTPEVVVALQEQGFALEGVLGKPENGLQHRWVRDGVKTDIFWYYSDGSRWWHAAYVNLTKQYRFYYEPFPTAMIDTKQVGPLLAPDPPEEFLRTKYGEDWRTPKRKWHFAKDPKNARAM